MKLRLAVAILSLCLACFAQPVVDASSVTNAASYLPPGLPGSGIAQGAIFIVKGRNLGACGTTQSGLPRPDELGGTSIRVTVGGTTMNAPMIYVVACRPGNAPDQLAAIMPSRMPTGDGTLTVSYAGRTSAPVAVRVVANAFGIFTLNEAGSGPAVVTDASYRVNLLAQSLRNGADAVIWGTGLGAAPFDDRTAAPAQQLNVDVEVFVGGIQAVVTFKGRTPGATGLDQINFKVPDGVAGCYAPLFVRVNRVPSNFATISVHPNSDRCSDPGGFTQDDLTVAQGSGALRTGEINLTRVSTKITVPGFGSLDTKVDTGTASFRRFPYIQLIRRQALGASIMSNSCLAYVTGENDYLPVDPVEAQTLDAGPVINVNGPRGAKQLTKSQSGDYTAQLGGGGTPLGGGQPDYLEPGDYTIDNGSGGAGANAVGPFRVSLRIPSALTWTNEASIDRVVRSQPLRITWTGGDPNGQVLIVGTSVLRSARLTTGFLCMAPVSAGSFTVPDYILSSMAPSSSANEPGMLLVGSSTEPRRFTASGLDLGQAFAAWMSGKMLPYQ